MAYKIACRHLVRLKKSRAEMAATEVQAIAQAIDLGLAALMELLQAAGVPAGVVQRSSDLIGDPLAHRRFFRRLVHPEIGEVPYEGHQFRIRGYDSGPLAPAPCLGEHSVQVLRELLGFTDDDLARIAARGALA